MPAREPTPGTATPTVSRAPATEAILRHWREAVPDDHVCVSPDTRAATAGQNKAAEGNRAPDGGPFGPDTCREGFVWRDAFEGDHVCVVPGVRDQAAADNRAASSRRAGA